MLTPQQMRQHNNLTIDQVRLIREPGASVTELAKQFNIPRNTVGFIRSGRYYAWFNNEVPPCKRRTREEVNILLGHNAVQRAYNKRISEQEKRKVDADNAYEALARLENNSSITSDDKKKQRFDIALQEGGFPRMRELEALLRDKCQLTESEWALLHRLRRGLVPSKYASMRLKNVKFDASKHA